MLRALACEAPSRPCCRRQGDVHSASHKAATAATMGLLLRPQRQGRCCAASRGSTAPAPLAQGKPSCTMARFWGLEHKLGLKPRSSVLAQAEDDEQMSRHPTDQISVVTNEGKLYQIGISDTTSIKDIRAAVADKMGTSTDKVRLAYQGIELKMAEDDHKFVKRQAADVMHAMKKSEEPQQQGPSTEAPQQPPPPANPVLQVYTMEGKLYHITVTPGVTTAGDIRKAVAAASGASVGEVRLQYAGKELDPSKDGEAIDLKEPTNSKGKLFVMHAMQRMQGGQWPSSHHSNKLRFKLNISSGTSVDANCSSSLKSMTAPGAGRGPAAAQLAKQFKDLLKHPIPGVSAAPDENDPMIWHVRLAGPEGSPYAGGWFDVVLIFPHNFPGSMPCVRFNTMIWHPNICYADGRVCMRDDGQVRSVRCVLSALQQLLKHPNPASALNSHCAAELIQQPEVYMATARSMTIEHAMG